MKYRIFFHKRIKREVKQLPTSITQRLQKVLAGLAESPRSQGAKKLVNVTPDTWRLRIGEWRMTYQIDDQTRAVYITHVLHRREAYRKR